MSDLLDRPALIREVFITEELSSRVPSKTDYRQEKLALQDLARQMADHPDDVLPRLVDLAIALCDGVSGGISLFELEPAPGVFRWHHLRGELEKFTGGTTPRHFSPCGVTLDEASPVLVAHPERIYTWLDEAGVTVPECLLVPLYTGGADPQGTLWIVSAQEKHFDSGHSRVMTELAGFAGVALRMLDTESRLQKALDAQRTLTREISHRIKNLFAITGGMIRVSARTATSPQALATVLTGRLNALAIAHELVHRDHAGIQVGNADLGDLVRTIVRPYEADAARSALAKFTIEGQPVPLSDQAANGFALVLHEFVTNAAKYGALADDGAVAISWRMEASSLHLKWVERGGPVIDGPPTQTGFGSRLVQDTVTNQLGGALTYDWQPTGLAVSLTVPAASLGFEARPN